MEHLPQDGVSNPTPLPSDPSTPLPASDRRENHLKTLKCLTLRLKKQLKLGVKPEPEIVIIPSYIDFLSQRCEQRGDKHNLTTIPPLSYVIKTKRCKIEGSVDCYTTGYICFYLQASRQQDESSPKPIAFDVKVFLGHPDQGEPLMVGEKKLILKSNKKVTSPAIITTYKNIQRSKYVKEDMIHFWWQVWVRESPTEIDMDLTKEISRAMSAEGKNLRELCKDGEINKIVDLDDGICTCLDPTIAPEPVNFRYRIDKIDQVLLKNKEMYTPLHESSSHGYILQGFLICREDNSLAAYLYLGPVTGNEELIWPVKIHWKVSLVNQALKKRKCMGEKISVYDKATPADNSLLDYDSRIEFTKDDIELSGMITNQSLTVEWTVWLDSPIYAVKAADLSHQCDELLSSLEDVLMPNHSEPDQPGNKDTDGHIRHQDMVHQGEQSTRVSGNFDLMVIGKSGEAKRMTGNSILQQHDFTKEEAKDKVKEGFRQFDDHIVTVVDCPLICNFKSEEKDKPGTAGNRLTNALVTFGDGFHAILFVSNIDTEFSDEELESIKFLKTHLADNIVRDFFIFVMIHNNDSNSQSETEFIHWCKMQTDAFGALLKECNYRYVFFHNANDDLSRNETQRKILLSIVSEMKSREFRMKKRRLDWNRIPSGNSHSKMEMILKSAQVLVQAFKEAKELYYDPEAAKCQIDELEKKACLLEKEISTCNDNSCMMTLKSTIIQLKATIASDRDIIEESKTLKDRIKQATIKCEELEQELEKKKMEFEKQLESVHSEEVEALKKKIAELESQLDNEKKTLTMYEKLYEESQKKPHEDYQFFKETLIKEYEEITSKRKQMHEEEMAHSLEQEKKSKEEIEKRWQNEIQNLQIQLEAMTKRNEEEQAKHTEDIQTLMKDIEKHKKEKDDMRAELEQEKKSNTESQNRWEEKNQNLETQLEAMTKRNEKEQAKHTEDIQTLMKDIEKHKKEKDDMSAAQEQEKKSNTESQNRWEEKNQNLETQLEAMTKRNEEEQAKHTEDIQTLMKDIKKHRKEKDDIRAELEAMTKRNEEEQAKHTEDIQTLMKDIEKHKKEKDDMRAELEAMSKPNEEEHYRHTEDIQKLMKDIEKHKKEKDDIRDELEQEKKSNTESQNRWEEKNQNLETQLEAMTKRNEEEQAKHTEDIQTLMKDIEKHMKEKDDMRAELEAMSKTNEEERYRHTEDIQTFMKDIEKHKKEKDDIRDELVRRVAEETMLQTLKTRNQLPTYYMDNGHEDLMEAARKGFAKCVMFLIGKHVPLDKVDRRKKTALMYAAENGSDECVKLLIKAKSEVNKCDRFGMTALMYAADNGFDECVKLLIEAKSEVNGCDVDGHTALMYAAENGSDECVKLLIKAKSEVNKCGRVGMTALMLAAINGYDECVKLLIEAKSDLNKCDRVGMTALIFAAIYGCDECVKLLIQAKSHIDRVDGTGRTAADYAKHRGNTECLRLLKERRYRF